MSRPHRCPVCDGSGFRGDDECPACGGMCVVWSPEVSSVMTNIPKLKPRQFPIDPQEPLEPEQTHGEEIIEGLSGLRDALRQGTKESEQEPPTGAEVIQEASRDTTQPAGWLSVKMSVRTALLTLRNERRKAIKECWEIAHRKNVETAGYVGPSSMALMACRDEIKDLLKEDDGATAEGKEAQGCDSSEG